MSSQSTSRTRWISLAVVCVALIIVAIDNTVLNLALPAISRSLGATAAELQWITDAYTLVFAALMLTTGNISDRFGRKRVLQIGIALFGIFSIGAALSTSTMMLIIFRGLLGIAGAMIMPPTLSITNATFREPAERAKAIAIWTATFTAGAGIGPVIGGYLLHHFDWASVFYLNVVVATIALIGGLLFLAESKDETAPGIDLPGVFLSIAGLATLVYAVIRAGEHGWAADDMLISFTTAIIFLALFVWWEKRAPEPMLPMNLLKNRGFAGASLSMLLNSFAMLGVIFLLSQLLQSVLGYSALIAGLCLLPITPIEVIATMSSPRIVQAIGAKLTIGIGLLLAAFGMFILSQSLDVSMAYWKLLISFSVLFVGLGIMAAPATDVLLSSIPVEKSGISSALNNAIIEVGGALGVAVLGAIFNSRYQAIILSLDVIATLPDKVVETVLSSIQSAQLAAAGFSADVAEAIDMGARQAFIAGMSRTALIGFIILVCTAVLALILLPTRVKPISDEHEPSPPGETAPATVH